MRPKSAIAEINTRGRAGVRPKSAIAEISTVGPHNHLTANLATTNGSKGAYLLDARLHPFIPFHCISQETVFIQLKSDGAIGCIMIVMALYF